MAATIAMSTLHPQLHHAHPVYESKHTHGHCARSLASKGWGETFEAVGTKVTLRVSD